MEDDDQEKMVGETEESAPLVAKKRIVSCDDLIEELVRNRSWKYTALVMSLMIVWLGGPTTVYLTSFAGIDPKDTDTWVCKSEKCLNLTTANASLLEVFPCKIIEIVDGKEELVLEAADLEWKLDHTSFSAEFDLYCDVGSRKAKKTLLSSIYFAGALTGLIIGGYLLDKVGRKKSGIIGIVVAGGSLLAGIFCHSYLLLLALRYFIGVGNYLTATAMYILTVELVTAKPRNMLNGWTGFMWSFGYPIAAAVGYFVYDWNYMFLAALIIFLLTTVQCFICIESPRFYLMNNDVAAAKAAFQALADLSNFDMELENVEISDEGKAKEREQSTKQQLIELVKYPALCLETAMLMMLWMFVAMFYYGFNFGWEALVPDIYLGYVMSAVGETIAYALTIPLIAWLGRRRAMAFMFVGAALSYLLAIPEVPLGGGYSMESIMCLFGIVFVSGTFSGVYMWTAEIAPTSHVGLVFCLSSGSARVGSFIGPYIFNNLALRTHKAVPLGVLAVVAVVCVLGSFLLVETGDKAMALTPQDIEERRKGYKYMI